LEIKSVHLQDVNISPKEVKVRSFSSLDISFSFNKLISKGFFFGIRLRGGRNNKNDWYYLQPYDPTKKGFFKLNLGQNIELIPILITGKELVIKYLICEEKGFPANTKIEITITNTLVQSIIEEQKKIEIFIETPDNKQKLFPNSPELTVVNEEFDHATLISPSTVCTKKSFSLLIRLEDRFSNLVKNYNDKFDLYLKDENNNIAFRKELISNENNPGLLRLDDIIIPDQGIYHFEISNNKQVYQSNTIICRESNQGKNLFWGYIHGHTNKSDGIIDPENYFINLKNAGLDFGTTTEHDHSWETNDDDFEDIKQITRKHHEEGKFITLFGYEWGYWYTGYGDICIYYYDDTLPIYRSDVNKYNSSKKLIKALKAHEGKVLMIGHHSALRPGYRNWEFFDNSMERLVEIYSSWGNQEYSIKNGNPLAPRYKFFGYGKNATNRGPVLERTDSYVQSALNRGYKLGFTAGGDDHFGVYPSGSIDPDNGRV